MTFDEYQRQAKRTAFFPSNLALPYLIIAFSGEVGELSNKIKKLLRDKGVKQFADIDTKDADDLIDELGDSLWYLAMIADQAGYNLSIVADRNIQKLIKRKKTGTLGGSGDHREEDRIDDVE